MAFVEKLTNRGIITYILDALSSLKKRIGIKQKFQHSILKCSSLFLSVFFKLRPKIHDYQSEGSCLFHEIQSLIS